MSRIDRKITLEEMLSAYWEGKAKALEEVKIKLGL